MSGIDPTALDLLHAPTPPERIQTRPAPGGGKPLSYVTARYVMERLDEIGPENWQDRYEDRADGSVRCGIGIHIEGQWVWKWDVGTESNIESDKGSYSDAFKRAAVKWGVGRDLYPETGNHQAATGGSSPRAVASPPRPAAPLPSAGEAPEEPDALREAFAIFDDVRIAQRDEIDTKDGFCPTHGMAWVLKPGGISKTTGKTYDAFWTCPSRDLPYCKQKPAARWAAAHERG